MEINASIILGLFCEPERMRDLLCSAFPRFVNEIHQKFAKWFPKRFGTDDTSN